MRIQALAFLAISSLLVSGITGCSSETSDPSATGDEQNVTSEATVKLTADFKTSVSGTPTAGKGLRIEYALERLPQCRGNVGGGGPGWNIAGYYSENGGPAKIFEVTKLSEDGKDRVSAPATIKPSQGGDLAIWFQVTSRFGCQEFDSQFGQNYHLDVKGSVPEASATISFGADGSVKQDGKLEAGGKVKVRYEQDRLPECRRTERGNPVWTISGFASVNGGEKHAFDTARPEGSNRKEIDALIDLPSKGKLALWFQVNSLGGCSEYDSNDGANYTFDIE